MITVKNIKKYFGGIKAVDDVNFKIESGKITSLIGPNGAGKTTVFDIVAGLIKPDSGQVLFGNIDIAKKNSFQRANLGISRIFQQVRLFKNLDMAEHMRMAQDNADARLWKNIFRKNNNEVKKYKEFLKDFGISNKIYSKVGALSYGQRKLLQIAMSLFRKHKVLMLDEPVAGVNAVVQDKIENILLNLKKKGETIILIDHDMNFVKRLSDKIIFLDAGKVLTKGNPNDVLTDRRVIEAYLGE